mmetsp:Transcript_15280/g.22207  ORF Transcript_15280/g.22207 Transcript_15280/m.22207 type:complete len:360 (+) Transcript_15280:6-1085(+)
MERPSARGCKPISQCECGVLLCSHTVLQHSMQGHSVYSLSQIEILDSLNKLLVQISSRKAEVVGIKDSIISEVEQFVYCQLIQLENLEETINELVQHPLNLREEDYHEVESTLDAYQNTQIENLAQLQNTIQELISLTAQTETNDPDASTSWNVLDVSKQGQLAAASDLDNTLRVWSLTSGNQTLLEGHTGPVESVVISSKDDFVFSGSTDTIFTVWSLPEGEQALILKSHSGRVGSLTISEKFLVSGSDDKAIRVWSLASGLQTLVLNGHRGSVLSVAISNKENFVVSQSNDNTIRVWSLTSGSQTRLLEADAFKPTLTSYQVRANPAERYVLTPSYQKPVQFLKDYSSASPSTLNSN